MMWWGWLIIVGIIIASAICFGVYARWRWEEEMKKVNAWFKGFVFGVVLVLALVLILERVW